MARLTDEQRLLRSVSEKAWQAQVEQTLALAGFDWIYHVHDSRKDRRGFPDLIAIRVRENDWLLVAAELKTETGRVRFEQARWLEAFDSIARLVNRHCSQVRMIVGIWRPSDAEEIWEMLTKEAHEHGHPAARR